MYCSEQTGVSQPAIGSVWVGVKLNRPFLAEKTKVSQSRYRAHSIHGTHEKLPGVCLRTQRPNEQHLELHPCPDSPSASAWSYPAFSSSLHPYSSPGNKEGSPRGIPRVPGKNTLPSGYSTSGLWHLGPHPAARYHFPNWFLVFQSGPGSRPVLWEQGDLWVPGGHVPHQPSS